MSTRACCGLLALITFWTAGCGSSGPRRQTVEGSVMCAAEPVPVGDVRFVPIDTDKAGPAVATLTAAITEGRYNLDVVGGLLPGVYRVEADARRKTGKQVLKSMGTEQTMMDETIPIVPDEFAGANSPLRLTVDDDFDGTFDIELPKRDG